MCVCVHVCACVCACVCVYVCVYVMVLGIPDRCYLFPFLAAEGLLFEITVNTNMTAQVLYVW